MGRVSVECPVRKSQVTVTIASTHKYGVPVRYLDFILKPGSINPNNEL